MTTFAQAYKDALVEEQRKQAMLRHLALDPETIAKAHQQRQEYIEQGLIVPKENS